MPLLPRIGPGEVVPLRPVRPDDVGGGVGQAAYAGAAQDLGAITERLIGAEREADVGRAEVGYAAKLAELQQNVDQNPDADAREAQFEEGRKAIADEFRKGLRGQQYQADFDQRAFQLGERAKLSVRDGIIRKRLDNARGGVIESVDKFDRLIEHAESDHLRKGYIFARSNILEAGVASGAVSAAERAQIEERSRAALEAVEMKKGSQDRADAIVAGGGSITAQLKAAREIEDPQMRDLVTARVKDMNEEAESAKRRGEEAKTDDLWARFHRGELTREQVVADPSLSAGLRNGLMAGFAARERSGTGEVVTDRDVLARAQDLLRDPKRREQARAVNLNDLAPFISKTDLEALKKEQIAPDPGLEAVNAQIKEYGLGLYEPKPGGKTPEQYDIDRQWREQAEAAVERERLARGRKDLSDDEVETVLKRQRQSWYKTEWGKDPRVFRFQLPPIPVTDQERIRTSLEAAGQVPTVDAIEAQWRLEQGYYEDEE